MVLTSLCVTECVFFRTKPWSQSASRTVHLNWWATLTQEQFNEPCGQFCAMVSNITPPAIKVLLWFLSKFHICLNLFWLCRACQFSRQKHYSRLPAKPLLVIKRWAHESTVPGLDMCVLKEKPTHFLCKPSELQFRNTQAHNAFVSLGIYTLKYNSVLKGRHSLCWLNSFFILSGFIIQPHFSQWLHGKKLNYSYLDKIWDCPTCLISSDCSKSLIDKWVIWTVVFCFFI